MSFEEAQGAGVSPGVGTSHGDVVEHIMRCCDDECAASAVASARDRDELVIAIGSLMASVVLPLPVGSPVLEVLTGLPVDAKWRDMVPVRTDSLAAELAFYESLYGGCVPPVDCPLDRLERLRAHAEWDLTD